MTLECFKKQFADSKCKMALNDAADYIHKMRNETFPFLPKTGAINCHEYIHRIAQRTACEELEAAIRKASPWQDYREIFAEFEWPYMRRVLEHIMEGRYSELYGEKEGLADAWFVEMWFSYHEIFQRMPGEIPNTTPWRRFDVMITNVEVKTRRFRRKL